MRKGLLITDAIDDNLKLIRDEDGTDTPMQLSTDKLKVNGNVECAEININEKHGAILNSTELKANGSFKVETDATLSLDSATGEFSAFNNGDEFSPSKSSYSGMILGYTDIGLNETAATYNLTTSYVVPTDEFSVSFTVPPSGKVEIFMQIGWDAGGSNFGDCFVGLSTANATSGYSALANYHEKELFDGMSRGALRTIRHSWTIIGLTAGDDLEYWIGFRTTSTTGTPHLQWGGDTSFQHPDFIMKAIALPEGITT